MVNKNYKDMSMVYWGNIGPWSAPGWAYRANNPLYNYSVVNEPDFFDKKYDEAANAPTLQEAYKILQEICEYALRKCYYIQLPTLYTYTFWQPWIRQYSGEYLVGRYYNTVCMYFYAWIDPVARQQITGQKQ
jgi:hypothetical protein